jgi:hypothetical protein
MVWRPHYVSLLSVFVLSFGLDVFWENAHSVLYASYQNQPITELVLLRASLGDALILTLMALPFVYSRYFRKRKWLSLPIGFVIAVVIELYALHVGRWAYTNSMPIIPLLHVGVTPAVQLGLLGYVTYSFVLL